MSWLSRLKKWYQSEKSKSSSEEWPKAGYSLMYESELPPEMEAKYIDIIARKVVKYRMGLPAKLMLLTMKPASSIGSDLVILPGAPFMEFVGLPGYAFSLLFRKRENIERLVRKIEELELAR